jgi:hypothetical protein
MDAYDGQPNFGVSKSLRQKPSRSSQGVFACGCGAGLWWASTVNDGNYNDVGVANFHGSFLRFLSRRATGVSSITLRMVVPISEVFAEGSKGAKAV